MLVYPLFRFSYYPLFIYASKFRLDASSPYYLTFAGLSVFLLILLSYFPINLLILYMHRFPIGCAGGFHYHF
jgi:hypothetical protein